VGAQMQWGGGEGHGILLLGLGRKKIARQPARKKGGKKIISREKKEREAAKPPFGPWQVGGKREKNSTNLPLLTFREKRGKGKQFLSPSPLINLAPPGEKKETNCPLLSSPQEGKGGEKKRERVEGEELDISLAEQRGGGKKKASLLKKDGRQKWQERFPQAAVWLRDGGEEGRKGNATAGRGKEGAFPSQLRREDKEKRCRAFCR